MSADAMPIKRVRRIEILVARWTAVPVAGQLWRVCLCLGNAVVRQAGTQISALRHAGGVGAYAGLEKRVSARLRCFGGLRIIRASKSLSYLRPDSLQLPGVFIWRLHHAASRSAMACWMNSDISCSTHPTERIDNLTGRGNLPWWMRL
jgi:hypothetical protein